MAGEEEMMAFIVRLPSTMMQSVQSLIEMLLMATRTTGTLMQGSGKALGKLGEVGGRIGAKVGNLMTGHGDAGIVSMKKFQAIRGDGKTVMRQLGFNDASIVSYGHNRNGDPDFKRLNEILRKNGCPCTIVREPDGNVSFLARAKDETIFDKCMDLCRKEFAVDEGIANGEPICREHGEYPDTFSYGGNTFTLDKVATDDAGGVRTWRSEGTFGGVAGTLYVWEESHFSAGNKAGGYRFLVDGAEKCAGSGIRCSLRPDQPVESAIVLARSEASTLDVTQEQVVDTKTEIAALGKTQPPAASEGLNSPEISSHGEAATQSANVGLGEASTDSKKGLGSRKTETPEERREKARRISNASAPTRHQGRAQAKSGAEGTARTRNRNRSRRAR